MTKEEIFKNKFEYVVLPNREDVLDCMQEYADQQTSEKNSEIERLKSELNELKERHKSDIINAIASCLYEAGDDDLEQEFHYKKAEKYYKQKFELQY